MANSSYAQKKLDMITRAAELGGEVTMPARQLQGIIDILDVAENTLREICNMPDIYGVARASEAARNALWSMDKRAEVL